MRRLAPSGNDFVLAGDAASAGRPAAINRSSTGPILAMMPDDAVRSSQRVVTRLWHEPV